MSKIICIGSACKDIFFPTAEGAVFETPEDILSQKKIQFELGAKYKIEERYEALGGCAANVAAGLSRLGTDAACYSHIGKDGVADWILEQMKTNGVAVDLVSKDNNLPSDMSAIVVDKKTADRVIFSNQKANSQLEIVPERLEGYEWIFIGDLHGEWEDKLDIIITVAQEKGIKVAYNPRQSNIHDNPNKIIQVISFSEILLLNKDEAMEVVGTLDHNPPKESLNDERFLLKELFQLGSKIAVLTDGTRGAWVYDGENIWHAGSVSAKALDSTGAGDAFSSGFIAAYLKEKNLEECLRWGIANSASEVEHYGSINGLLDETKILEKANGISVEAI